MNDSIYYPVLWLVILLVVAAIFMANGSLTTLLRHTLTAEERQSIARQLRFFQRTRWIMWSLALVLTLGGVVAWYLDDQMEKKTIAALRQQVWPRYDDKKIWEAPDLLLAETDERAKLIRYGRDLIARTQDFFGATGLVRPGTINGLNCQNCHLAAGSKPFGNNYFAVASTYPQLRWRSGALETIPKRVNDCFMRSLNGQPLDTTSKEMQAIIAYIEWLGTGVPTGAKPQGVGLVEVPLLDRAANPAQGQLVYAAKCASCHGTDGQGLPIPGQSRHYPPLWGPQSYNQAAGLFRLSRFAGYVKANMPFGASYLSPQLSDEEAWDVAAFVNSQPRPAHPFLATDWPKISKKPFDHPFGPFADSFPAHQHKFGPFQPIIAFQKAAGK